MRLGLAAIMAALAIAPPASASCIDPARGDHATTLAMPDSYWRGHPAWSDLTAAEQDLLARTAIATRNRRARQASRPFQVPAPDAVAAVPGHPGVMFVSDGIGSLLALLDAANAGLPAAGAKAVLGTGYRSYDEQLKQWPVYVKRYFLRQRDGLAPYLADGRYTDDAVCAFRDVAGKLYGFPGFSNHQSGRAIDFRLQMGPKGGLLTASTEASAKQVWCASDFYRWMTVHARVHGFVQENIDEPWHWVFDPAAAQDPVRANFVAPSCR